MCDNEQLYAQSYPSPIKNEYNISHSHSFLAAILIGVMKTFYVSINTDLACMDPQCLVVLFY
jgi:hypothetical protein